MTPGEFLLMVVIAAIWPILTYAFTILRAKRQGINWRLRVMRRGLAYFLVVFGLMKMFGRPLPETFFAALAAEAVGVYSVPARSRRVPKSVRRQVIERFERETGETFDPTRHHLDHIYPFSKGGSHTLDNLRVLEKKKNIAKGARRPNIDEFPG